MNSFAFVDHAAEVARLMVARETRCHGDTENAMRRLEARYGIPYSTLWALRYRKPKTIDAGLFARVAAAYDEECDRQRRALEHERQITKAKGWISASLVRAASAVAGEEG